MPKIFHRRSGSWTEVKSVFHKRNGAWTEVLNVFRKTSGSWVKVFSASKIPGNTVAPTITGSGYLFGTLTNTNLGTWTNTPTSYARQWRRGNPSSGGGEPTSYSNISGATSSTYVTTSSDNGKYVVCQVTATNAVGNNLAVSNSIYISKYAPVSLLPYTLSGSTVVGGTLTAQPQAGSWKETTTNSGDTSPDSYEYEWSWSTGEIIQSTAYNSINSTSYLIVSNDNGRQIRFRATATNSGGSATSSYTTSGTITSQYSFAFGNTLYVGSNGYITLDQAPSSAIAALPAGNGRTLNIWNEDLVQYRLQEYSDSSNYHLYFRAYRYQSPLVQSAINALDYQIKFYTGQPYCDVYLVRKGSSVPTYINNPGYYSNGLFGTSGFSGTFTAGSVLRIYFNGTTPASTSAASWTSISDTLWKDITTSQIDDSFTSVVTSANQQAPTLTAPTLNSVTPGPQGGQVSANFTGGSGPYYQMFWWGTATAPTSAVTPDATRTFSPLIDSTGPSSTATQYMYVRSVASEFDTSLGPSSIASAWSNGIAFNMTSTAVSQNTAPSATATSTGSTTIVKYGDSITWAAGTYTNAASITSVLLYSTNTSNLVSPGGNTNSSTRASSPYTIQTNDPTGTPYVFAVRDIVVGTNGTTYYFYSNQITSALADAIAFSYGTATGANGGWSATVNSGTQTGATYSISTTTGYSVNSSTGTVTVTGLGSNVSTSISVTKSVAGYNNASATASGTSNTVASGPTNPTGLAVTAGAVSSNLSTSLTRNSATNKTQSWTTSTSQSVSVTWTKGTGTGTITSEVKWNQSGATPGSGDSGTWTAISGSSQSDSNGGGSINYYWVRTVDGNSLKSDWVYAGSYTATSPSMSGLVIRIYRGSFSGSSGFSTGSASSTSTSGSYTYSGLTNRDASPDFGHYAYASGTLNGVSKTATSSTV
jgi:hypothetical protein